MARVDLVSGALLAALVIGLALVLGVLLGLLPVYPTNKRSAALSRGLPDQIGASSDDGSDQTTARASTHSDL